MNKLEISLPRRPGQQELVDELRRRIRSGELPPEARLPSFAELQQGQGYSRVAVEGAYAALERDGLIRREPKRGVFVAPQAAKAKHQLIGLYMHTKDSGRESYSSRLLSGLRRGAARQGWELLLLDNPPSSGWERVDGLLVYGNANTEVSDAMPAIPTVALMWPHSTHCSIDIDDFQASRRIGQHLIGMGHRRIAYMGFKYSLPSAVRVIGYGSAFHTSGLPYDHRWIRDLTDYADNMIAKSRRNMEDWLREDWHELGCTAIVAQNDYAAIGIMQALQATGLSVPRDVSVVGFDDIGECEVCTPRLTTIAVPLEEIGERAMELLAEQINGEHMGVRPCVLPTRLVVRESTAPPRD